MMWICLLMLLSQAVWAVDPVVVIEKVSHNSRDKARIIKGGHAFKTQCLTCHALSYWRYDEVATSVGITQEMMPMWPKDAWGGHPPPDLSLIALEIGVDKLYTYLTGYVEDLSRPTGANNLVYPNTSMPNVLGHLQGKVYLKPGMDLAYLMMHPKKHWYQVVDFGPAGQMSHEEFDEYITDIVHFLSYVADPSIHERQQIGPYVVVYLIIAILLASYWFSLEKQQKPTH